ncbi:MAG: hypothetical protein AB1422_08985 [bacterium]
MDKGYKVWFHNNSVCEKAIVEKEEYEAVLSGYGENDFWIEFLVRSGLWETMVSMQPTELKKENGKSPRVLNSIEILRELADIEAISQCGKVLSDARLMLVAGFLM